MQSTVLSSRHRILKVPSLYLFLFGEEDDRCLSNNLKNRYIIIAMISWLMETSGMSVTINEKRSRIYAAMGRGRGIKGKREDNGSGEEGRGLKAISRANSTYEDPEVEAFEGRERRPALLEARG